jgi:hypothetical protein
MIDVYGFMIIGVPIAWQLTGVWLTMPPAPAKPAEHVPGTNKNKTGTYALHVAVHVCNLDLLQFKSPRQAIPHILQEEPPSSNSRSHSVLTVGQDEKTVYCPESDLSKIESFTFDYVYRQNSLTDTQLLQGSVAHLIKPVLVGEAASVFVMGGTATGKAIVSEGRSTGRLSGNFCFGRLGIIFTINACT